MALMQALLILIGIGLIWFISSGFICLGFYILKYLTVIPENESLAFTDALGFGEYIFLSLILAAIVSAILNAFGIIDLRCLSLKKKEKNR